MDTRSKIITRPLPADLADQFSASDGEIVAIWGRFELLQGSVLRQIEQAGSGTGAKVVAIVVGDGPNPALLSQRDRAQLVAALRAVEAVVICDEAQASAFIAALRPTREIRLDESADSALIADVLRRNQSG